MPKSRIEMGRQTMNSIVNAILEWKQMSDDELYRKENKPYYSMIRAAFYDTGICNQHALKDLSDIELLDIYVKFARKAEKALNCMNQNIFVASNDL